MHESSARADHRPGEFDHGIRSMTSSVAMGGERRVVFMAKAAQALDRYMGWLDQKGLGPFVGGNGWGFEKLILRRCPPYGAELIELTPLQLHSLLEAAILCINTKASPLNAKAAGKDVRGVNPYRHRPMQKVRMRDTHTGGACQDPKQRR